VDEFDAAVLGFKPRPIEDLAGGDAPRNAEITLSVLRGEKGAPREVCLLNAAWAIMAAGLAKTVEEGLKAAEKSIDSGAALKALESLKKISHD
jgi:anthranilate phosphoribosyltransferase